MLQHTTANSHNIVLSYADMSAWCYGCDHYVHNAVSSHPHSVSCCLHYTHNGVVQVTLTVLWVVIMPEW